MAFLIPVVWLHAGIGLAAETTTVRVDAPVEDVLDSPVTLKFENVHVKDIIEFCSETYKVILVIDWGAGIVWLVPHLYTGGW